MTHHVFDAGEWQDVPLSDLVQHILDTYHAPLMPGFKHLKALAGRARQQCAATHGVVLDDLLDLLGRMESDLEHHLGKEEAWLFPAILEGLPVTSGDALEALGSEHGETKEQMDSLRAIAVRMEGAALRPRPVEVLLEGVHNLLGALAEHMELEDRVLFPRVVCQPI